MGTPQVEYWGMYSTPPELAHAYGPEYTHDSPSL